MKIDQKVALYFIVLVALAGMVDSAVVFEEDVTDNIPFYINEIKHVARYYPSAEKASILAGEDRVLVEKGDCQAIGSMTYCLGNATVSIDDDTGDPTSVMEMRVEESGPDITIDRNIGEDEPDLNGEVAVTATISNEGNVRATNVNFEDNYPSSVTVGSTYKSFTSNGILWSGSLNPGESKEITYRLTFKDFVKFNSTAKASVIYNGKVRKSSSSSVLFDVQRPFDVSETISAKSVDLGQDIDYSISIENNGSSDELKIKSLKVVLPEGTKSSKRSMHWDVSGNTLEYSGNIAAGESDTLSFSFSALSKVQGDLVTTVDFEFGDKRLKEEYTHKIGIGVSAIAPKVEFSTEEVTGGRELEIDARITNEGDSTVSEISMDLNSDIVENKGFRHIELEPGSSKVAFNKIINAPTVETETDFFVKVSGSYASSSGKTMQYSLSKKVTVLPAKKVVELDPEIKVMGDEVNVTLNIRNVADYDLASVSLIDMLPKGFTMTAGARDTDLETFSKGSEMIAYSYVVKIPATHTADTFVITHIFNGYDADDESIMYEEKSTVTLSGESETGQVETETPGNDTQETETTAPETALEPAEDEQKPGIFKRMWHWFVGLFSWGDDDTQEEDATSVEEDEEQVDQGSDEEGPESTGYDPHAADMDSEIEELDDTVGDLADEDTDDAAQDDPDSIPEE